MKERWKEHYFIRNSTPAIQYFEVQSCIFILTSRTFLYGSPVSLSSSMDSRSSAPGGGCMTNDAKWYFNTVTIQPTASKTLLFCGWQLKLNVKQENQLDVHQRQIQLVCIKMPTHDDLLTSITPMSTSNGSGLSSPPPLSFPLIDMAVSENKNTVYTKTFKFDSQPNEDWLPQVVWFFPMFCGFWFYCSRTHHFKDLHVHVVKANTHRSKNRLLQHLEGSLLKLTLAAASSLSRLSSSLDKSSASTVDGAARLAAAEALAAALPMPGGRRLTVGNDATCWKSLVSLAYNKTQLSGLLTKPVWL